MADIRCPHCGKENPDFLDLCQFCQNPLKPESKLRIGENPTKKNTGELEKALPDWLKDARQQARDSAEEDAAHAAAQPKVQKEEPLDLLAGLAFQSGSADEEDIPDWLSSINPVAKDKSTAAAAQTQPEPESDFFAQFNKSEPAQTRDEPVQPAQMSPKRDELSEWFIQASEEPEESATVDSVASHSDWGVEAPVSFGADETPAPKQDEDLSWLHNLESAAKQTDELNAPKPMDWANEFSTPAAESSDEDLSWLNSLGAISASEQTVPNAEPAQPQDDMSWLDTLGGTPSTAVSESSEDDLSWLNKIGGTPIEPAPSQPAKPQEDLSWLHSFSSETPEVKQTPPSSSQEDLSWLNSFGGESSQAPQAAASAPQEDLGWLNDLGRVEETPTGRAAPQEDLSWLNALGGEPPVAEPPSQASSDQDLTWLNNLGSTPAEESASVQPTAGEDLSWLSAFQETSKPSESVVSAATPSEDLSWLNSLGATPADAQSAQASATQDDLSWLNTFGESTPSSQPASTDSSADDLSWLSSLQGEPDTLSAAPFSEQEAEIQETDAGRIGPFMPRKTAPLDENAAEASMPDWLKSATQGPSMPMGAGALDQFREDYKIPTQPEEPFSWKSFTQEARPTNDQAVPAPAESAFFDTSLFGTSTESSTSSAEDVNSLFSMEMPDWMSQPESTTGQDASQDIGIHAESGETLAPVDLPSWVQAMRPVDAAIAEATPSIENQPTEREGPLAGFRGVLPTAPLGSARRPKPLSLKLQATDEQQASVLILEQLLAGETTPRPLTSSPVFASQSALRRGLALLFWVVLSAMIFLRSQMFTPSAVLPAEGSQVTSAIQGLPDGANVLVVVDYDPALAGELEAVSGPLLDQLAMLRHPNLSFLSTSPNGPALVARLMSHTNISKSLEDGGLGYSQGQNYFNLGYLPGAEPGVLAFIQSPKMAMPLATVNAFSEYSAVLVLTDNADSARIWIEQLQNEKERNSTLALQPLLLASSAQAGPMLQPYVSSSQVNGLITGLADASRFEFINNSRPGIARSYWDAFGAGLVMAIGLMVFGSLWGLFAGFRARRAEAAEE